MYKAKALIGKYSGQLITADNPEIHYDTCKEWQIFCPECYQWVHLRKSEIISSYFAHYNNTDKNCSLRVISDKNDFKQNISIAHEQDLEIRFSEFLKLFDDIDKEFDIKVKKISQNLFFNNIRELCINNIQNNQQKIISKINNSIKERQFKNNCFNFLKILCIEMNQIILKIVVEYIIYQRQQEINHSNFINLLSDDFINIIVNIQRRSLIKNENMIIENQLFLWFGHIVEYDNNNIVKIYNRPKVVDFKDITILPMKGDILVGKKDHKYYQVKDIIIYHNEYILSEQNNENKILVYQAKDLYQYFQCKDLQLDISLDKPLADQTNKNLNNPDFSTINRQTTNNCRIENILAELGITLPRLKVEDK
jgi:hypothetical protein